MPEKKEQNKFTIQFNPADPAHRQVMDLLNQQGRRKAQFIVNAIQHYLHCKETPDIPQSVPVDTRIIEDIVQRILERQNHVHRGETMTEPKNAADGSSESISFDNETAELLGESGLTAIANTMAAFRKG